MAYTIKSKKKGGQNVIDFKNAEYLKLMEVDPRKGAQQVEGMLIRACATAWSSPTSA